MAAGEGLDRHELIRKHFDSNNLDYAFRAAEISSGGLARKLQNFIVQIPPKDREKMIDNGPIRFWADDIRGNQFAVLASEGLYAEKTGLLWENADCIDESIF